MFWLVTNVLLDAGAPRMDGGPTMCEIRCSSLAALCSGTMLIGQKEAGRVQWRRVRNRRAHPGPNQLIARPPLRCQTHENSTSGLEGREEHPEGAVCSQLLSRLFGLLVCDEPLFL